MRALIAAVRATPSIPVLEGLAARELMLATAASKGSRSRRQMAPAALHAASFFPARAVVLATGGAGSLYAITTNPREARGEGIAIAARAGAVIADAEFVQFHPTAIDFGRDPAPLATEALRGEGATLINSRGERFMREVHADAELGPRDVVARAVYREIAAGAAPSSIAAAIGDAFAEQFPTVYAACRAAGIDPAKDPIPVAPAAHYHMGGILTDAQGTEHRRRAVGLRRGRLDRSARRQPARVQLAARGGGVRRPRRQRHRRLLQRRSPTRGSPGELPTAGGGHDERLEQVLRRTMSAEVGVVRDETSLTKALGTIFRSSLRPKTTGASPTCSPPPS